MRPRISAIVTTFNEEENVGDCLDSLAWCDEILVVDSFSTDRTPEICRSRDKVRFLQRDYYGGASQKNWAMPQVRFEWTLVLDADERCSTEMREEIEALLTKGPEHDAYNFRRRNHFLGKPIRYSGLRNDRVVRFVRTGTCRYQNRRVHSRMITPNPNPAPFLRAPLEHLMTDDLVDYIHRMTRYGYWSAAQAWIDGKQSSMFEIGVRTLYRFLRTFIIQFGFLDGTRGFVLCLAGAVQTYVRWATLWTWRCNARKGILPQLPTFDPDPSTWESPRERVASPGGAPSEAARPAGPCGVPIREEAPEPPRAAGSRSA